MQPRITVGDVVRLRCGGPDMVVLKSIPVSTGPGRKITVSWIDRRGQLKTATFATDAVSLASH